MKRENDKGGDFEGGYWLQSTLTAPSEIIGLQTVKMTSEGVRLIDDVSMEQQGGERDDPKSYPNSRPRG